MSYELKGILPAAPTNKRLGNALLAAAALVAISGPLTVLLAPAFHKSSAYRTISFLILTGAVSTLLLIQGFAQNGAHLARHLVESKTLWIAFLAILTVNMLICIIAAYS